MFNEAYEQIAGKVAPKTDNETTLSLIYAYATPFQKQQISQAFKDNRAADAGEVFGHVWNRISRDGATEMFNDALKAAMASKDLFADAKDRQSLHNFNLGVAMAHDPYKNFEIPGTHNTKNSLNNPVLLMSLVGNASQERASQLVGFYAKQRWADLGKLAKQEDVRVHVEHAMNEKGFNWSDMNTSSRSFLLNSKKQSLNNDASLNSAYFVMGQVASCVGLTEDRFYEAMVKVAVDYTNGELTPGKSIQNECGLQVVIPSAPENQSYVSAQ